MQNSLYFAVAFMTMGVVSCGAGSGAGAEPGTPPIVEPPTAPPATPSVARPSRPPPNCRRPPVEVGDGGIAPAPLAESDAGISLPIIDADRVVASLRGQFRACYQKGLQMDPELDGCVVLSAKIAPDGSVSAIEPIARDRLLGEVIACLAGAVRDAHFTAPGGAGSTLNIPITFVSRQKDQR